MRYQIVENIKTLAITSFCVLMSVAVFGQSESPKTGPPAPNMNRTPPGLSLPIDSELFLLLLVGVGYGIYIAIKRVRSKNISQ